MPHFALASNVARCCLECYGVATINRLLQRIGLFCRLYSLLDGSFAWSAMGWLQLVGSLKLSVSFAKEPYKRDYTLQKRLII